MSRKREPPTSAIAAALRDLDVRCHTCGYNLRGCTSDQCPECGVELKLAIDSADSRRGWWLASIFGTGLSALFWITLLLKIVTPVAMALQNPQVHAMVSAGLASPTGLPRWRSILFTIMCCLLSGGLLCWVVSSRRLFDRWRKINRQLVGLSLLALPLLMIGLVYLFVRL